MVEEMEEMLAVMVGSGNVCLPPEVVTVIMLLLMQPIVIVLMLMGFAVIDHELARERLFAAGCLLLGFSYYVMLLIAAWRI